MRTRLRIRHRTLLAATVLATAVLAGGCTGPSAEDVAGHALTQGSAQVAVTGGTEVSYEVPLERAQVGGAATVLVYSSGGDLFSITGLGIEGSAKSGPTLPVVLSHGSLLATSSEGECTIELHDADDGVTGTASCSGLDSSQGTIDVDATFSATP